MGLDGCDECEGTGKSAFGTVHLCLCPVSPYHVVPERQIQILGEVLLSAESSGI